MRFPLLSRSLPGCSSRLLVALLLAIVHPALTPAHAAVAHREVIRSGHIFSEAPDLKVQEFFGSAFFSTQESLNARGDVLCLLPLVPTIGSPTMEIQGLVFSRDDTLKLLAKTGDPVPAATSGETILTFNRPTLNNDGRVGVVVTDSNDNQAVLSWQTNIWTVVARSGDPAPGLPGHAFVSFGTPSSSLDGPIMRHDAEFNYLVGAQTTDGQNNHRSGIWNLRLPPESHQLVLLSGGLAPDESQLGTGSILAGVFSIQYASPPSSKLLIKGYLDTFAGPGNFTNDTALWLGPADDLRVLLRTGVTPPADLTSALGEIFLTGIEDTGINGAGAVSVAASWVGPTGSDSGLLRFNGTTWQVAARKGDPVTGLDGSPAGVLGSLGKARINAAGQIGFLGNVIPPGGGFLSALFRWDPATGVKMLARQGTGDWPVLLGSWRPDDFAINAAGQVTIYAANPFTSIPRAIYTATTDDALQLVAYKDTSIPPVVGELRVRQLPAQLGGSSGGEDGRRRVFNDHGDLLYPVEYEDNSGPGDTAFVISHVDYGWFSTTGLNDESWFPIDGPQIDVSGLIFDALEQPFGLWEATSGAPENWVGGSVRFQITQGFGLNDTLELIYATTDDTTIDGLGAIKASDGRLIGNLSRPAPDSLQVDFAPTTLAADVANILSRVVFGTRFMAQLHVDVRHLEPPRNLRAIISPSAGASETNDVQVSFPSYDRHQIEPNPQRGRVHLNLYLKFLWGDGTSSHASSAYEQLAAVSWEFDPGTNAVAVPITQTSTGKPAFGLQVKSVNVDEDWETPIALNFLDESDRGTVKFTPINESPSILFCPALSTDSSIDYERELTQSTRRIRMNNPEASGVIPLYYALREALRRSPEGRRLVDLYYANGPEIVRLMIENPDLIEAAGQILDAFAGLVNAYVSGNGQTLTIDAQLIDQLNLFAEQIIASASPELAAAINDERARFNNLQDFIGKNMAEWGQLLAIGAPDVPLVALSLPVKLENGFQTQANRIAGFTYSLWRTMDPAAETWLQVTQPDLVLDSYSVTLSDTNAPNDRFFYRVQATQSSASQ